MSENITYIDPQEGYQMKFLSTPADIAIGGGAAGVGKTFGLLMECIRNTPVPGFGATVFRRTMPQIKTEGGLWDASLKLFSLINNAYPTESRYNWTFIAEDGKTKNSVKFAQLEYEKTVKDYQGSEIPLICFDELTHFTKKQFFYMLSRNRSTCGVKPYVRATCNPDPDSWVREFIDWFIGPDGYPIPERQGVLRYFMVHNDRYIWGASKQEVIEKAGNILDEMIEKAREKGLELDLDYFVKSMTFIGGSIYDNKELLKADPAYLGNLNAQDEETKLRLLGGNWNIKHNKADIYPASAFKDIFTNHYLKTVYANSKKCITTDIALKGSDKFVVFVWKGKMLIDFLVMSKSKGNEIINSIKHLANKHQVQYRDIIFDNDGVGQFVDGFIPNAQEFNNGGRALEDEMYFNLKSQCFFRSGIAVNNGEYYIPEEVANRPYDDRITLKERLLYERKAIKQMEQKNDGKLRVIPKSEMKVYLDSQSPDLMDAFGMREYADLMPGEVEFSFYN